MPSSSWEYQIGVGQLDDSGFAQVTVFATKGMGAPLSSEPSDWQPADSAHLEVAGGLGLTEEAVCPEG